MTPPNLHLRLLWLEIFAGKKNWLISSTKLQMYAFIHIPKTAGSTLRIILRQSFGARHCDIRVPVHARDDHIWVTAEDLRLARRVYPRLAGIAGHRVTSFQGLEAVAPGLRYFTFLREPHARFISHFRHHYRKRPEQGTREAFLRFCADPQQRNVQTRWLCGSESAAAAVAALDQQIGFVGLTEDFDASLLMFCRWLNLDGLQLRYRSQNERRPDQAIVNLDDAEARELVAAMSREDDDVYRHAVNAVVPRQRATYGGDLERDTEQFVLRNRLVPPPRESMWAKVKRNWIYKPLLHVGAA